MKKIAIITARSGSKGLPNKNVLLVNGKPLMAYSIEAALESQLFNKVIVSTDSQEYIDLLNHYPIEFIKRAEHLASDTASSFVVLEDVLTRYSNYDYFVLLQPTSPLRTAQHIQEACSKFEEQSEQFDFLVSVTKSDKSTALIKPIEADGSLKHFQLDYSNYARQKHLTEYAPNGAIFIAKPAAYLKQKHFFGAKSLAYMMEKSVSIDIDDSQDFEYFYFLMQQKNKDSLLLENIKKDILYKRYVLTKNHDIGLIGHSIFAQWDIEHLNNQSIGNFAISGITIQQYNDYVLTQKIKIPNKILIFLGINDLRKNNYHLQKIINNLQQLIENIRVQNPVAQLYFLECLHTAFRIDCHTDLINEFNSAIRPILQINNIIFIQLNRYFTNQYGKLDLKYSYDGLHLNEQGYQLLTEILEKELS